jgi:hypothetical protein
MKDIRVVILNPNVVGDEYYADISVDTTQTPYYAFTSADPEWSSITSQVSPSFSYTVVNYQLDLPAL